MRLRREHTDDQRCRGVLRVRPLRGGRPGLLLNRVQVGVDFTADADGGPDDPLTVVHPVDGRLAYVETGIDADDVVFEHLAPRALAWEQYWLSTVAHVRDIVLPDPWAAAQPIMLDQAFRSLAAALLSTFPNTALARVSDPQAPVARGDASEARLREVVDYLDTHADRPVAYTRMFDESPDQTLLK